MKKENISKVMEILNCHFDTPIILQGVSASIIPNVVVVSADIPSSELGVVPSENGYKYPAWAMELLVRDKKGEKSTICIDGLDSLPKDEQEKFYGMITYKGVNGFKFPKDTSIVILVKDIEKVSSRIRNLTLSFKAD